MVFQPDKALKVGKGRRDASMLCWAGLGTLPAPCRRAHACASMGGLGGSPEVSSDVGHGH